MTKSIVSCFVLSNQNMTSELYSHFQSKIRFSLLSLLFKSVHCTFRIKIETEFETYNQPFETPQLSTQSRQEDHLTHLIYDFRSSHTSILEHRRRQSSIRRWWSPPLEHSICVRGNQRRSCSTQHVQQPTTGAHRDKVLQASRAQPAANANCDRAVYLHRRENQEHLHHRPSPASTTTTRALAAPPQTATDTHRDQPLAHQHNEHCYVSSVIPPSRKSTSSCVRNIRHRGRCLHMQHHAPPRWSSNSACTTRHGGRWCRHT
jgi:hypothetical protein